VARRAPARCLMHVEISNVPFTAHSNVPFTAHRTYARIVLLSRFFLVRVHRDVLGAVDSTVVLVAGGVARHMVSALV